MMTPMTHLKTQLKTILLGATLLAAGCASQKHIARTQADGEALRADLAATYVDKGAYDAAIPLLRRALLEKPRSAHIRTLYGKVLREKGLYPQAERELIVARGLAPKSAKPHAELGILYALEHRQPEAESSLRAAVALAPQHAPYWNNLGFSLYVNGKMAEAVTAYERALAIDPSLIVTYNNLGFAYGKKGDLVSAERSFRNAGGEAAARLNMAILYEERGDKERAATLRAQAKQIDPDAAFADESLNEGEVH